MNSDGRTGLELGGRGRTAERRGAYETAQQTDRTSKEWRAGWMDGWMPVPVPSPFQIWREHRPYFCLSESIPAHFVLSDICSMT